MANPRQTHAFQELHTQRATYDTDASITFSRSARFGTTSHRAPVKVTGYKTVGLCADGDVPFGTLERVDPDGSCVVAYHGAVEYAGQPAGGAAVVANGAGQVRAANPAATPPEAGKGLVVDSLDANTVIVFQ